MSAKRGYINWAAAQAGSTPTSTLDHLAADDQGVFSPRNVKKVHAYGVEVKAQTLPCSRQRTG